MVGERGPELLDLPRGASVIPLDRQGGGNNISVNVVMNNPVISSQDIADGMARQIARYVSDFLDDETRRL